MWDILAPLITTHSLSNNEHYTTTPKTEAQKNKNHTLDNTPVGFRIAYLISSSVIICVYYNDTAEKRKLIVQNIKKKLLFIVLLEKCDSTHSSFNIFFFCNFVQRSPHIRSLLRSIQSNFKKISQRIKFEKSIPNSYGKT